MAKKTTNKKAERKSSSKTAEKQVEKKSGIPIVPRGKAFEGNVTRKLRKRIAIEFERMVYVPKYERYTKVRSRIHARLPESMEKEVKTGDKIRIKECRPISKMISFVVTDKLKDREEMKSGVEKK